MPGEYRRMKDYEDEILKMSEEGKTKREIWEAFGFTMKQMGNFITRHNSRQRKLAAGKEAKINSLEMENFFLILKTECIYWAKLKTYDEASLLIGKYLRIC